jgi:hypothetical protein
MDPAGLREQHPGLLLYFVMYRNLMLFMLLASLVMIGPMVVNSRGKGMDQLSQSGGVTSLLNFLTLGNVDSAASALTMDVNIFCQVAVWFLYLLLILLVRHYLNRQEAANHDDPDYI